MKKRCSRLDETTGLAGIIDLFSPGDLVYSILAGKSFYGVVAYVDKKANKIVAMWPGGRSCQHDPDEIALYPIADESIRRRWRNTVGEELNKSVVAKIANEFMPEDYSNLRSRRAIYYMKSPRVYRKNKFEKETGELNCPRCRDDVMSRESFQRGIYIYICPSCGFKITTDKLKDGPDEFEEMPVLSE